MDSPRRLQLVPEGAASAPGDDELLLLAGAGDRRAFALLVERHQRALLRVCTLLLRDNGTAEEAAQESFLRLWRARAEYRPQGRLRQYLFAIARNECRSRLRRRKLKKLLGLSAREQAPPLSAADALQRGERAALVDAALQRLPEGQRIPLTLRFRDELSYAEIAAVTGLKVPTARSRVHRGLEALAGLLGKEALP